MQNIYEKLGYEIIPDILTRYDHETAEWLGNQYNASMIIWGESKEGASSVIPLPRAKNLV